MLVHVQCVRRLGNIIPLVELSVLHGVDEKYLYKAKITYLRSRPPGFAEVLPQGCAAWRGSGDATQSRDRRLYSSLSIQHPAYPALILEEQNLVGTRILLHYRQWIMSVKNSVLSLQILHVEILHGIFDPPAPSACSII